MNIKKQRTLAIFALAIALVATTVAYAVLQTTLSISGSVTKKGGTWDIKLANVSTATTVGTGKMTTAPKISGTTLTFAAELAKPGDSVSFTFDVVNNGSVDAKLGDGAEWRYQDENGIVTSGDFQHINVGGSIENISLSMTYADGTLIKKDDLLNSKATKKIKITFTYDNVTSISPTNKTMTLSVTLPYVQV